MIKVKNRRCIRSLSTKSMKASKTRNFVAILAIILTTVLFTSLFTIALSINRSFQEANFRQCGGWSHGTFKYMTQEQYNELKDDPLIKEYGLRRFIGMPEKEPFNKSHVEVGYSDANQADWMYCDPETGRLPEEGTNQAATDTKVLSLLGIEPKLGAEFTVTFDVDGTETTETFTLCGFWEYDEAIVANHVLIPQSRADEILKKLDTKGLDGITGTWNMDVMFSSSINIEQNMRTVLQHHGYQDEGRTKGDNFISTGVNWGYTGSQVAKNIDPATVIAISALLLLIIFTGYLIIYNVFRISVTNDIRFYGLLKTIGTTGKQIKRIIRIQALSLSAIGIPLGLLTGYAVGIWLTPVVLSQLNGVVLDATSASPLIFIGSAVFSLITVIISCLKPGRIAARVSPVEAVRYTEGKNSKKTARKAKTGASLPKMAWANLGRSRSKTAVTIISLSLAVVLLNLTVTFTNGFDMDKYLRNMVSDFIVSDASYFQVGNFWGRDNAVPQELIDLFNQQGGIENGGKTYGKCSVIEQFVTEEYYRSSKSFWNDPQAVESNIQFAEHNAQGLMADDAQLYGMERYTLDKLKLLEGDISKLYEPGSRYIAAVFSDDDYDNPRMDSHWAKLGDKVTLRYVDELEYYNPITGEIYDQGSIPEDQPFRYRAVKYKDVDYEVAALVTVPSSLSYRYYGTDEFILNDRTFIQDSGTENVMYYAFDTTDEGNAPMEELLSDITTNSMTQFDYESKETYAEEFESFRGMFLMLGGVLCFIVGLVGVLNFLNAVLTGIVSRRREFAVLQSIGMTGKQLKAMLVWEGLYYAFGSILISLVLSVAAAPLISTAFSSMFWFFTYRFTLLPVLIVAPIFTLLGVVLPLITYHFTFKQSIVERLREAE